MNIIRKDLKSNNDKLFRENLNKINELCLKNYIPSEIAREIGMDRHALLNRLRKFKLKINIRGEVNFGEKVCSRCRENKILTEFVKNSQHKSNYSSMCKGCRRKYITDNKISFMFWQARGGAKRRNLEFNIDKEDIVIPEYCPMLRVKLELNNIKLNTKYSPSLDRIDNSKGYIKDNIQVISMRANLMKNDASLEELLNFSKYFISKYEN